MSYAETLQVFESLRPGDQVELVHEVKVGFRVWNTTTQGQVVQAEQAATPANAALAAPLARA